MGLTDTTKKGHEQWALFFCGSAFMALCTAILTATASNISFTALLGILTGVLLSLGWREVTLADELDIDG